MKILDGYIKSPLKWDSGIIFCLGILFCTLKYLGLCTFSPNTEDLQSLLNELVSSSVSIGGFVIAALTIIITFKENVKAKEASNPTVPAASDHTIGTNVTTGLELLFKSHHYKSIVRMFYWSAFIFIFAFLYFSAIEIMWKILTDHLTLLLCLIGYGILMMVFAVVRCLLVLNQVIQLQMGDLITQKQDEV